MRDLFILEAKRRRDILARQDRDYDEVFN